MYTKTHTDEMQEVFLLYSTGVGILFVLTLKERILCPGIVPGGLAFLTPAVPRRSGAWMLQAFQAVRVSLPSLMLGCVFSSADHRAG